MTVAEIVMAVLFGGGGIFGLFIYLIKRSIDKKLDKVDKDITETADLKHRKALAEDELAHAQGRMFFWLHRYVVTGEHNGELEKAWTAYETAEQKNKDIQREIIAHFDNRR